MVERYTDETKSALELNVELKLTSELSETGMSAEWKSYDDVPRSKESARKIFKAWIGRRRWASSNCEYIPHIFSFLERSPRTMGWLCVASTRKSINARFAFSFKKKNPQTFPHYKLHREQTIAAVKNLGRTCNAQRLGEWEADVHQTWVRRFQSPLNRCMSTHETKKMNHMIGYAFSQETKAMKGW